MDNRRLRPMRKDDFKAFHAMMSDFDVAKMSMSWPYPPDPDFTRQRMQTEAVKRQQVLAIECEGQYAGQVSIVGGELGYLLAKPFWGRGLATWAARKMLARAIAGTWHDNPASMRVLEKCGFVKTGEAEMYCKPRGRALSGPDYEITRRMWQQQNG